MRHVTILLTLDVEDDVPDAALESLCADAFAQIDDPRDDEGEHVTFDVYNADARLVAQDVNRDRKHGEPWAE